MTGIPALPTLVIASSRRLRGNPGPLRATLWIAASGFAGLAMPEKSAFELAQQAAHVAVHVGVALAQVFDQAHRVDHG